MPPLAGYRILDLSLLLPGPLATQILRDLGASVTKLEPPISGDTIEFWPPLVGGSSAIYRALNRGKECESIDLKAAEGRSRFENLAIESDVVVEGFRPGVMERLGVGYGRLSELNPRIVFCSITGYGQGGPYNQRAGHDIGYQALAGALSLSLGEVPLGNRQRPSELPEEESHSTGLAQLPANPQLQVADTAGGAYVAAMLILAALIERQRTGQGRHLDISMSEQLLPLMTASYAAFSATDSNPVTNGEVLSGGAPCYRIYRTLDGQCITLGALEPKFWKKLVEQLGVPELEGAPYLGGPGSDELSAQLSQVFASRTRQQWEEIFRSTDACCEPILSLSEVSQHPHWVSRQSFTKLHCSTGETLCLPKMPGSLAGFDTDENRP